MHRFKKWQTKIVIGNNSAEMETSESGYLGGESINELKAAAKIYLVHKKPTYFTNGGDHIAGIYHYFYFSQTETPSAMLKPESLEEGWWWFRQDIVKGSAVTTDKQDHPERLANFSAAVDHFLQHAIIPKKGLTYQSVALLDKQIQLPLLEKILREDDDHPVNDLIQRGWHIVALEYKGEASTTGELVSRRAIFVMGHPEAPAAGFTLNSTYYRSTIHRRKEKVLQE
jgi:hypothetical protein